MEEGAEAANSCQACHKPFNLTRKSYKCELCHGNYCSSCSSLEKDELSKTGTSRICECCKVIGELLKKLKDPKSDKQSKKKSLAQLATYAVEGYQASHGSLLSERIILVNGDITLKSIGELGSAPVLVSLLKDKDVDVVTNAGTTIYQMLRVVSNHKFVELADSEFKTTLSLIQSKDKGHQALGAAIVEILALEDERPRIILAKSEGLVKRGSELAEKETDLSVVLAATDMLRALSQTSSPDALKILAKETPRALVRCSRIGGSKPNLEQLKIAGSAAMAITNLAQKVRVFRYNVVDAGGAENLVALMKMTAPSAGEEAAALCELLHLTSCIALAALAQTSSITPKLADAGAIRPAVSLLTAKSDEAIYGALTLLVVLAQHYEVKPKLADSGAIPSVLAIASEWTELKPMAILVLIYMAEHPKNHERLFAAGVIKLCKTWIDRDATLQMFAALLLGHISQTKSINKQVVMDAFRPLQALVHSRDPTVKFCALYTMAALSSHEPGRGRVQEKEILADMMNITKEAGVNVGQFFSLQILASLLDVNIKQVRVFISWIFSVLSDETTLSGGGTDRAYREKRSLSITEMKQKVPKRRDSVNRVRISSVSSVTISSGPDGLAVVAEDIPGRFIDQDMLPTIMKIATAEEVEVARFAGKTLFNLSTNPKHVKALCNQNGINELLEEVEKSKDEAIKEYARKTQRSVKKYYQAYIGGGGGGSSRRSSKGGAAAAPSGGGSSRRKR